MFISGSSVCIPHFSRMMQRLNGLPSHVTIWRATRGPRLRIVTPSIPHPHLTTARNEQRSVDNMAITDLWKRLSPAALNFWIQTFSLIAIFFEGVSGILSSGR